MSLVRHTRDECDDVIAVCATALGLMNAPSELAAGALADLLAHDSSSVRVAAGKALVLIGAPTEVITQMDNGSIERKLAVYRTLLHRGEPPDDMVPTLVKTLETKDRFEAIDLLAWMGPAAGSAADALATFVRKNGPHDGRPAIGALGMIHAIQELESLLKSEIVGVARSVAATLEQLGERSAPATSQLIANLSRDMKISETGGALLSIGTAALPQLIDGVRSSSDLVVRRCVSVLSRFPSFSLQEYAPEIAAAVTQSRDLILDSESAFQLTSLKNLVCKIGAPSTPIASWLLDTLSSQDREYLGRAVVQFAEAGIAADAIIPDLSKLLHSETTRDQVAGLDAASAIGVARTNLEPAVRAKLDSSSNALVRLHAAFALWTATGMENNPFLNDVQKHLADCSWKDQQEFAVSHELPPDVRIPLLLDALTQQEHYVGPVERIIDLLVSLPGFDDEKVDGLAEWLYSDRHRPHALRALGKLADAARAALPAIRRCLNVPCQRTQVNAAYAVWKIENTTSESVDRLARVLRDGSDNFIWPQPRMLAANLLRTIGPPGRLAEPALRYAALSKNLRVRNAAKRALRSVTSNSTTSLPGSKPTER